MGVVCVQVFTNKPSDSPPSSHQVSPLQPGGKARAHAEGREKGGVPPAPAANPALAARVVQKSRPRGSQRQGAARRGPSRGAPGASHSKGGRISDEPLGPTVLPSASPAFGASPHPIVWDG